MKFIRVDAQAGKSLRFFKDHFIDLELKFFYEFEDARDFDFAGFSSEDLPESIIQNVALLTEDAGKKYLTLRLRGRFYDLTDGLVEAACVVVDGTAGELPVTLRYEVLDNVFWTGNPIEFELNNQAGSYVDLYVEPTYMEGNFVKIQRVLLPDFEVDGKTPVRLDGILDAYLKKDAYKDFARLTDGHGNTDVIYGMRRFYLENANYDSGATRDAYFIVLAGQRDRQQWQQAEANERFGLEDFMHWSPAIKRRASLNGYETSVSLMVPGLMAKRELNRKVTGGSGDQNTGVTNLMPWDNMTLVYSTIFDSNSWLVMNKGSKTVVLRCPVGPTLYSPIFTKPGFTTEFAVFNTVSSVNKLYLFGTRNQSLVVVTITLSTLTEEELVIPWPNPVRTYSWCCASAAPGGWVAVTKVDELVDLPGYRVVFTSGAEDALDFDSGSISDLGRWGALDIIHMGSTNYAILSSRYVYTSTDGFASWAEAFELEANDFTFGRFTNLTGLSRIYLTYGKEGQMYVRYSTNSLVSKINFYDNTLTPTDVLKINANYMVVVFGLDKELFIDGGSPSVVTFPTEKTNRKIASDGGNNLFSFGDDYFPWKHTVNTADEIAMPFYPKLYTVFYDLSEPDTLAVADAPFRVRFYVSDEDVNLYFEGVRGPQLAERSLIFRSRAGVYETVMLQAEGQSGINADLKESIRYTDTKTLPTTPERIGYRIDASEETVSVGTYPLKRAEYKWLREELMQTTEMYLKESPTGPWIPVLWRDRKLQPLTDAPAIYTPVLSLVKAWNLV